MTTKTKKQKTGFGTEAWNFSVKTTRQAFYKMLERDDDCVANVFDLVFSELTISQLENINDSIDAEIWKELFLEKENTGS